jgi:O-antigen/teichoic acid export membrane protein
MTSVRRAFLWASVGRYLVMVVNLAATLVIARLLAPAEYGVSVLGAAVFAVAEAIRTLGGGAYLIQKHELAPEVIRASFTISLLATLVLMLVLAVAVGPLTSFFSTPDLEAYLLVAAIGFVTGPFVYPISALMSRDMEFGRLAFVGGVSAVVNAIVGVTFAVLGFSYMSLAWASAASSIIAMVLYFSLWRDWSIFRPIFSGWCSVIAFGAHDSANALLAQIGEAVPYLIFGRALDAGAVGLCQRAALLCFFPERVILAGVGAVALPAFARQRREGQSLKASYLKVIELITAAQWPSLLLLIVLAEPIVRLLLGPRWMDVVPLMRIRYLPPVTLVQSTVAIAILAFAALHGLYAVALSTLLIVPFAGLLWLLLVRHFLQFGWLELGTAIWRSAIVTLSSAAGPLFVAVASGWEINVPMSGAAAALSGAGWMGGLWLTRHPLLHEMKLGLVALRRRVEAKLAPVGFAERLRRERIRDR